MTTNDQLVTGQSVRPRMTPWHAHDRTSIAMSPQAGAPVRQPSGGQRERFEALERIALDAWMDGLADAHACLSRGVRFRYSEWYAFSNIAPRLPAFRPRPGYGDLACNARA